MLDALSERCRSRWRDPPAFAPAPVSGRALRQTEESASRRCKAERPYRNLSAFEGLGPRIAAHHAFWQELWEQPPAEAIREAIARGDHEEAEYMRAKAEAIGYWRAK